MWGDLRRNGGREGNSIRFVGKQIELWMYKKKYAVDSFEQYSVIYKAHNQITQPVICNIKNHLSMPVFFPLCFWVFFIKRK